MLGRCSAKQPLIRGNECEIPIQTRIEAKRRGQMDRVKPSQRMPLNQLPGHSQDLCLQLHAKVVLPFGFYLLTHQRVIFTGQVPLPVFSGKAGVEFSVSDGRRGERFLIGQKASYDIRPSFREKSLDQGAGIKIDQRRSSSMSSEVGRPFTVIGRSFLRGLPRGSVMRPW